MRLFVNADHAGNIKTTRSRTGYVQMIDTANVDWFSKNQGIIETSTFGSEFVDEDSNGGQQRVKI